MIRRIVGYLQGLPPVFIDGALYVMLSVTAVNAGMLMSDTAKELIGKGTLFYVIWGNTAIDAALLSLKMFRSTSFATHQEEKKTGMTQFLKKDQT